MHANRTSKHLSRRRIIGAHVERHRWPHRHAHIGDARDPCQRQQRPGPQQASPPGCHGTGADRAARSKNAPMRLRIMDDVEADDLAADHAPQVAHAAVDLHARLAVAIVVADPAVDPVGAHRHADRLVVDDLILGQKTRQPALQHGPCPGLDRQRMSTMADGRRMQRCRRSNSSSSECRPLPTAHRPFRQSGDCVRSCPVRSPLRPIRWQACMQHTTISNQTKPDHPASPNG